MHVHVNFQKRLAMFQGMLREHGIDVLVGTRLKTITHMSGAFVPWRSVVVVPAEGEIQLITVGMDGPRVQDEGWLTNVAGYGRTSMIEMAIRRVVELGFQAGRIAVEDGYSWYLPEGTITHHEYRMLEDAFPDGDLINLTHVIDRFMLIKEPEQIALMRQATALSDAAQEAVRLEARPGMTETEIAGIAERVMRNLGSEFAWTFTGGQEIASGHRTWTGACTPSTRKIVQRGEFLLVDLHGMYDLMLGDVSHNAVMGEPRAEQQDAFAGSVLRDPDGVLNRGADSEHCMTRMPAKADDPPWGVAHAVAAGCAVAAETEDETGRGCAQSRQQRCCPTWTCTTWWKSPKAAARPTWKPSSTRPALPPCRPAT